MRILTFTTLFPNSQHPTNGVFVENRLRHLVAGGAASSLVVAPVPWFPFASPKFGRFASLAKVPSMEERNGLTVYHPRYPVIPKIGMSVAPLLLYLATRGFVRRLLEEHGDVDVIDAHYFYPDGVAAVLLGRELGKPVVITARGTDLNLIPHYALPRWQIRWAARHADGLVTVCQALKNVLVDLGVGAGEVRVLRNGVDLVQFRPCDRAAIRRRLGLQGKVLLSVGGLIPRKGHDLILRALVDLPEVTLLIAGGGPDRGALERLAVALGVADRVRFLGVVPHQQLAEIYSAADALVLASDREGWANVLLEAMACGTPAIATPVWGNVEVVSSPTAGVLAAGRTPAAIVEAVRQFFSRPGDREATRDYAEGFSWDATSQGQIELFRAVTKAVSRA